MTRRTLYRTSTAVVGTAFVVTCSTVVSFVLEGRPVWALIVLSVVALQWWLICTNWNELRAMRHPIPPVNVRIVTDNGTHPVECRYDRFDGDRHHWQIIAPDWLTVDYCLAHGVRVEADEVAAGTAISLSVTSEP